MNIDDGSLNRHARTAFNLAANVKSVNAQASKSVNGDGAQGEIDPEPFFKRGHGRCAIGLQFELAQYGNGGKADRKDEQREYA